MKFQNTFKSFYYIAFLFLQLHSVSKLIKQSRPTQRGSCLNGCMSAMCFNYYIYQSNQDVCGTCQRSTMFWWSIQDELFFFFAKGIPFRSACTASISLNLFLGERQGGGSLVEIVFDFISKFKKKEKESFGQQKKRWEGEKSYRMWLKH